MIRLPLLLIAAVLLSAASGIAKDRHHAAYRLMIEAAQREQRAEEALYARKLELGLWDSTVDPNRTGLIGQEYSTMTTTLGNVKAKRTAANPDFAAYIVRELVDHGIGTGDTVLVTMTGSFAGLDLAVLMALETLHIPSLRVCSIGASSFGANQEEFTWLDIENFLVSRSLLSRRSDFATLGGSGDVGGGINKDSRLELRRKAERMGYRILKSNSASQQRKLRREELGSPQKYALLINIGGNYAMLGGDPGRDLPGGWIEPYTDSLELDDFPDEVEGIVFDYLEGGVPVLNLLHIEDIAAAAGIPFDPPVTPAIGDAPFYFIHTPSDSGKSE